MGTRGTLHVYVNGELKIRQYNQWDSYPTGQFQSICDFMRGPQNLERLTEKLLNVRFATKEEQEKAEAKDREDNLNIDWLRVLTHRDYGASILWTLAGSIKSLTMLPDWMLVHEEEVPEGKDPNEVRLSPEEGNYIIEIECEVDDQKYAKYIKSGTTPRFRLSGEYWGVEHVYDWDYIPTEGEVEDWEHEVRGDE